VWQQACAALVANVDANWLIALRPLAVAACLGQLGMVVAALGLVLESHLDEHLAKDQALKSPTSTWLPSR
jgi:hypothetical protein